MNADELRALQAPVKAGVLFFSVELRRGEMGDEVGQFSGAGAVGGADVVAAGGDAGAEAFFEAEAQQRAQVRSIEVAFAGRRSNRRTSQIFQPSEIGFFCWGRFFTK